MFSRHFLSLFFCGLVVQFDAYLMDGSGGTQVKKHDAGGGMSEKARLKAERRAKQEKERALKQAKKAEKEGETKIKAQNVRISSNVQADDPKIRKKTAKKLEREQIPKRAEGPKKVGLFSHLHQYQRGISMTKELGLGSTKIHPSILRLGLQYAEGVISGSNARCAALINAMKEVVLDYQTPPDKELSRDLESKIKPCITFLNQCRPLSVSMQNAIKFIKAQISSSKSELSDVEAKHKLCESFDNYVEVNIHLAGEAISKFARQTIKNDDVVLIYGGSSLINRVLIDAHNAGCNFRVVVVDGRPRLSGIGALQKLTKAGISCSYTLVSGVTYLLPEITKVMYGAHGLLSNGYVIGAVGTSLVSLAAQSLNIPVIVCCETYKFCERVQTDSIVNNEIGDPLDLLADDGSYDPMLISKESWNELENLKVLHLTYDVTPPDLIATVVTDLGMIPCTSVPVVLRLKNLELDTS
ncbi:translation initiation factor eIF2B subunit delta-like [Styela clava]